MHALSAGRDALVLDFADEPDPAAAVLRADRGLRDRMRAGGLPGVIDLVPSARSVLVQAAPGTGLDVMAVRRAVRQLSEPSTIGEMPSTSTDSTVVIPTVYDGRDLAEVADQLGWSTAEAVAAHTNTLWRVQFMGFAPGFGYLVCEPDAPGHRLTTLARHERPRTRVPAGAVAIAAGYSAVYPRSSPGGWRLLGHTTTVMWDTERDRPSTLTAGTPVRFEVAR